MLLAAASSALAAPGVAIVKLDPNPVERGTPLHVLYQIVNTSAADATFQVQIDAGGARPFQYVSLAAGAARVSDVELLPPATGSLAVKVTVWEQVGTRFNIKCPTCPPERVPRYGNPVVVSRVVNVYDPIAPPPRLRESLIGPSGKHGGTDAKDLAGVVGQIRGTKDFLYVVSKHNPRLSLVRWATSTPPLLIRATFESAEDAGPRFEDEARLMASGGAARSLRRVDGRYTLLDATADTPDV